MHQTTIHVRWGELDPYNHVNHAVYSSYLEHARVDALEHLERAIDALAAGGVQVVVVRSDLQFRAPATAGDTLVVSTRIGKLKGASMTWLQQIDRDGQPIVEAVITAATVNRGGRPVRMPPDLRSALASLT